MPNIWLEYWNRSPRGAVKGRAAAWAIGRSGVSDPALKINSGSRSGSPVQAQKASATVRRRVSTGSATANAGSRSTTGVSQASNPSSTAVAAIVAVIGLVTEPTIIRVSGVTRSSPPRAREAASSRAGAVRWRCGYTATGAARSTARAASRVRSMSAAVWAALTWLRLSAVGSMKMPRSHMAVRKAMSAAVSLRSRSA